MTRYADDKKNYGFEAQDMRALEAIKHRLYDDQPLSGDQRRDLANVFDAIMRHAVEL